MWKRITLVVNATIALCLLYAGVSLAAVTTAHHATYALRPCSICKEIRYPTEQECRDAAYAEAERVGLTRETGAAVYQCITRYHVIGTFRANPMPPVDCVVSEWGAWSDPPWLECADGLQSRSIIHTRTIVMQPVNGGAACPSLVETQPQTRVCPGAAILSWTPPTRNTDGSALTNLAGYRIHYGASASEPISSVQLVGPLTRYVLYNLPAGTHYFGVRAFSSAGAESDLSNVVPKVVQ